MDVRKYLYAALLAAAGCISSSTYTSPKPTLPADLTAVAREHSDEFKRIALESVIDNIERGGVAQWSDRVTIREIENDVRKDEERYRLFINGDSQYLATFSSHASIAGIVQAVCCPASAGYYTGISARLCAELTMLPFFPPDARKERAVIVWMEYDALTRHNMYIRDPQADVDEKTVLFHFHTHQNGQPPSRQDIELSKNRDEVVASVNRDGMYKLYYVHNEDVRVIDSIEPTLVSSR